MTVIDKFQYADGSHMPLSNFYAAPIQINEWLWPTAEHYFQASKTDDPAERAQVWACTSPGDAKRAGRLVTLRPGWNIQRFAVMRHALTVKFSHEQHPELVTWLLSTGDALLVEGNNWGDTTWGVYRGLGANWLGVLLMARRAELRSGEKVAGG